MPPPRNLQHEFVEGCLVKDVALVEVVQSLEFLLQRSQTLLALNLCYVDEASYELKVR